LIVPVNPMQMPPIWLVQPLGSETSCALNRRSQNAPFFHPTLPPRLRQSEPRERYRVDSRKELASRCTAIYIDAMRSVALPRPRVPITVVWWLIRLGVLAALVFALAGDAQLFDASRECRGAFSSAFSSGFDVHRCKLTVKAVGSDFKFAIPLPQ
jgi:hypothetical protein